MTSKILSVLFVLVAGSAASVWAQPGDLRTPEEIRQQLNDRLEQAHEQIRNHPEKYNGYEMRGRAYAELSWRANDRAERLFFVERALADFDKSIELEPNYWPNYVERARLKDGDPLKNFEDIRSDYSTAIRLIKKSYPTPTSSSDYDLQRLYNNLSYIYIERGERLATNPELIADLNLDSAQYSAWDDFDKGIAYAKKGIRIPAHWWTLTAGLLRKGDLAFRRRDYERALATYQNDEEHLGKDYALVCESNPSDFCRSLQRDFLLTFSIRRGRAYLKLGRAEEALRELNVYFDKAYHLECQDIFLLRAQAHWALGNDELALADEETAKKKGGTSCPFDVSK